MSGAAWALIGVVVGGLLSGAINWALQSRRFSHEKEMFLLENQSAEMVKDILTDMLNHRKYTDRSFEALRKHIGGYSDDELRQFLHEVGAKRVTRDNGSEWWYLLSRQEDRIENRTA